MLDRPDDPAPDQPGMPKQKIKTSKQGILFDGGGSGGGGASLDGSVLSGSVGGSDVKSEVPRFARKWHAQEAVAPRDFSLGA